MKWSNIRDAVLTRDKHVCDMCNSCESLEVHHIIPRIKNGSDEPDNLVTLCYNCHKKLHREHGRPSINRSKEIENNPLRAAIPNEPLPAIAKVNAAGQISIPIEIRDILGLKGGDYVTIDILRKVGRARQGNSNEIPCQA